MHHLTWYINQINHNGRKSTNAAFFKKNQFFLLLAFEPSFKLSSDALIETFTVRRFRVKYFRQICCETISVSMSYSEYLGQSSVRHSHDTKFSRDLKRRDVPYLGYLPLPVPPSSTLISWGCCLQQLHVYVCKRQSRWWWKWASTPTRLIIVKHASLFSPPPACLLVLLSLCIPSHSAIGASERARESERFRGKAGWITSHVVNSAIWCTLHQRLTTIYIFGQFRVAIWPNLWKDSRVPGCFNTHFLNLH